MKKKTLIIIIIAITIFMVFFGGYYLIRPSLKGEKILSDYKIPYPTVIAHRGSSYHTPESTEIAYKKAVKDGADYLEADLHQTADGKIVIFHDKTLERTSDIKEVFPERADKSISNFTLEELKKLDIGTWYNKKYPERNNDNFEGLEILTLEELIDISRSGRHNPGLILELKNPDKYDGMEKKIIDILSKKGVLDLFIEGDEIDDDELDKFKNEKESPEVKVGEGPSRIIFFSFNLDSLKKLKELAPEFPRLLLINDSRISRRSWRKWLKSAEDIVNGIGTKGWTCWPWHIAAAHNRELFVFPYTINRNWEMEILSHFKADGYITDQPEKALKFLQRFYELPEITDIINTEEKNE